MKVYLLLIGFVNLLCLNTSTRAMPVEKILVKGGHIMFHGKEQVVGTFQIAKYETTNSQFAVFLNEAKVGADGVYQQKELINVASGELQIEYAKGQWSAKSGYENYPMVMVNYYGAAAFSSWIGGRLPTEAEWYYAAQGGILSDQYKYAGSNSLNEVGWFSGNSERHAHTVGLKKANELGIYDMSGNVWEWCLNTDLNGYPGFCVHMGGSWYAGEQPAQLSAHYGNKPDHYSNSVGFRVLFPSDQDLSQGSVFLEKYQGKPWKNTLQEIPGKVQCELYDLGGEGVAYHDYDSVNNGSGKLNPANGSVLNEFRMHEAVDISYTKPKEIDNNGYNLVEPAMEQLYVGWTVPGEWLNYSVKIQQSGKYTVGMMYTASGNGGIQLLLDGKEITKELLVPTTRNDKEPVAWRQWHHWNRIDNMAVCELEKGVHVLTVKTVSNGNMNYDYLEFKLKD